MKRHIFKGMVFGLPLLALLCLGWADSWDGIRAAAGRVTSVQSAFIQKKHLPILDKPLESKGIFYYQAPRSLRWEYRQPVRSILLMHDGRVRRFSQSRGALREETGGGLDAMQVVMDEITQWLSGRFEENPIFEARLMPERRIVLTPRRKEMSAVIMRIELMLSQQPGLMQSVLIYESPESWTELQFEDPLLNPAIDPALFRDAR